MNEHRIGLTDDQRRILERRVEEYQRAERVMREMVQLIGGPGARYLPSEGVVVTRPAEEASGAPPGDGP